MSKNIELIESALQGFPGCRVLHVTEKLAASGVWCALESMEVVASLARVLNPSHSALVVVSIDNWQGPIFCVTANHDADTNSETAFAIQAHNVERVAQKTFEPASELVM